MPGSTCGPRGGLAQYPTGRGGTETGVAMVMKPLMDQGFVERDPSVIQLIPLAIVGLFLVRGLADFFTTYGLGWIARVDGDTDAAIKHWQAAIAVSPRAVWLRRSKLV